MSQSQAVFCPPPPLARKARVKAPPGMTDTHFHIFGATEKYPLVPSPAYQPAFSPVADYRAVAEAIGIERMVVVQAGVYGTNNSCLLDSIAELGPENTRGIAVVDQTITASEIARMHERGIRGIRFNAITGRTPIEWLPSLASLIAPFGWHIQLWIESSRLMQVSSLLEQLPVPVILDHMGQFPIAEGMAGVELQNILRLLRLDHMWIKLIGYRVSNAPPAFDDLLEPVKAMMATAPDRCVWGSDWPHIFLADKPMPNTTDLFETAFAWMAESDRQRIFVDNPARLYGFR